MLKLSCSRLLAPLLFVLLFSVAAPILAQTLEQNEQRIAGLPENQVTHIFSNTPSVPSFSFGAFVRQNRGLNVSKFSQVRRSSKGK